MPTINFDGFPEKVSDTIEIPNIAELMLMPFFQWANLDDIYKHGTDYQRYLIDKTSLTNKTKYVNGIFQIQFLHPGVIPIANKVPEFERNWHFDGIAFNPDTKEHTHLLLNDVNARTEFNTNPFSLEVPEMKEITEKDYSETLRKINELDSILNPVKMEPNKITTFTAFNIHRVAQSTSPEFRFIWRVYESDFKVPYKLEMSMNNKSIVSKNTERINSIEKNNEKITIYLNF